MQSIGKLTRGAAENDRAVPLEASVKNLYIHPIKSLDRVRVEAATILPGGGFEHDREFALFDAAGNFINGKKNPLVHHIRCEYDLARLTVNLKAPGRDESGVLHLVADKGEVEKWFREYFGTPLELRRNLISGFPDDMDSPGPTVVSAATLQKISEWFPGITDAAEISRRFRSNIEIDGVPAFWEDMLFRGPGEVQMFVIGAVAFSGVNPCSRCVVPSRDSQSAENTEGFMKKFAQLRRESLPEWTNAARFDHFYRVAVNTRLAPGEAGKSIRIGDLLYFT